MSFFLSYIQRSFPHLRSYKSERPGPFFHTFPDSFRTVYLSSGAVLETEVAGGGGLLIIVAYCHSLSALTFLHTARACPSLLPWCFWHPGETDQLLINAPGVEQRWPTTCTMGDTFVCMPSSPYWHYSGMSGLCATNGKQTRMKAKWGIKHTPRILSVLQHATSTALGIFSFGICLCNLTRTSKKNKQHISPKLFQNHFPYMT